MLEATRHSFFQESDDLRWPTSPFAARANRAGKKNASEVSGAGVFLSRSDAEQARALIAQTSGVEESWIEELPIGI